ncbi:hypothetical protein [Actinoallomurus oryzae]|uniref:hypothetical protein n=1 Tax=Actinoallomurus oryzae TaxID=502180 RepID=UPI0031E8DE4C
MRRHRARQPRRTAARTFTWVPRAGDVSAYIDAQFDRARAGRLAPADLLRERIDGAIGL